VTEYEILKAKIDLMIEAECRCRDRGAFDVVALWHGKRKALEKQLAGMPVEVANAQTRTN
jgi:hypothetical protein